MTEQMHKVPETRIKKGLRELGRYFKGAPLLDAIGVRRGSKQDPPLLPLLVAIKKAGEDRSLIADLPYVLDRSDFRVADEKGRTVSMLLAELGDVSILELAFRKIPTRPSENGGFEYDYKADMETIEFVNSNRKDNEEGLPSITPLLVRKGILDPISPECSK